MPRESEGILHGIVEDHDKVSASATSDPAAIPTKALLMDSCVSLHATWSRRVALAAVWQSLYLFATLSAARKMISERIYCSRSLRRSDRPASEVTGGIAKSFCGEWDLFISLLLLVLQTNSTVANN
jgi:hypothetical protein